MGRINFVCLKFLSHLLVLGVLIPLLSGCAEAAPESAVSSPMPAPTSTRLPNLTPSPDDLTLVYQQTLTANESLIAEVINESDIPYVFYEATEDNCLFVQKDVFFSTRPPETCDVLAELIVAPGQRRFFGSWDLFVCTDYDCLTRTEAAPGPYFFEATFYLFSGSETLLLDEAIKFRADFVIKEGVD